MADIVDIHTRQKVVIELQTVGGSSLKIHHRRLRSMYAEVAIYVILNGGFVVLRVVERSLVTGPARTDQPQQ
jgi:hypothetical protein